MAVTMTTAAQGGDLIISPDFRAEIEALVYAKPTFLSLCSTIQSKSKTIYLGKVETGPSFEYVAEAGTKPLVDLEFARDTLTLKKMAGISRWSEELESETFVGGLRALFQREMAAAAADQIDARLFSSTAESSTEPGGLLSLTGYLESTFSGVDTGHDILGMLRQLASENYRATAIVCHPTVLFNLMEAKDDSGAWRYPSTHSPSPSIWNCPIVTSTNVQHTDSSDGTIVSTVYAADWSKIVVATGPADWKLGDQAVVDSVSLYQNDLVALRLVTRFSTPVLRRDSALCVMEGVSDVDFYGH